MMPAEAAILPSVPVIATEPKARIPMTNRLLACALALLSGTLVGGCIHDRDWHAPRPVAAGTLAAERTLADTQINEDAWPRDDWWRTFGDPQLDSLMAEVLAGSPSLQIAQARLQQAQAVATSAAAPRLPNTTA